jgi:glycosyltransferase involved in cell wall biosynthesis
MCPAFTGAIAPEAEYPSATMPSIESGDGNKPRILIDLTTSWHWKGKHAVGILRTEREIARRLIDNPVLQTLPVVFHENAFRAISDEYARSLFDIVDEPKPVPVTVPAVTEPAVPELAPAAVTAAKSSRPIVAMCLRPFGFLARWLARTFVRSLPVAISEEVRLTLVHGRQACRNLIYPPLPPIAYDPAPHFTRLPETKIVAVRSKAAGKAAEEVLDLSLVVHPGAQDVLFVCGLSWDVLNWPRIAEMRQELGLRIVGVMYDLIPIKHPEFVGGPQPVLQNCFLHMVDNCDLIFCISACTEVDFKEFVSDNGRPPVPTEIIYLGANVPSLPSPDSIPDEALRARLARGRFALAVGTFEIRKNYGLLVDLWEDLLTDPDFDLDLVIVGMPGWLVEDTVKRLEALPAFGTRIHWFKGLSDSGLSWLYETCHVFLFPSLYEGWGLPVAEALLHKSPTIASSRGATPEAAFGQALILDPDDKAAWRQALVEVAHAPRRIINFDSADLPSWDHTAKTVERTLMRIASGAERQP